MNIYSKKQYWKSLLLLSAIAIGILSLFITNNLVGELANEERKKVELWAEGMRKLTQESDPNQDINFIFKVIENNETIPVIVVDANNTIVFYRNLDSLKALDDAYLQSKFLSMKTERKPIEVQVTANDKQYIYYEDSILLKKLFYYPFIQLFVVFLFISIAYFAFSSSRKAEQNQVWVGMSKETAHQLGTPISSLMAWIELLKIKKVEPNLVTEINKDVSRLETITERFSKIGSAPKLTQTNVVEIIENSIKYIKTRSSKKVIFETIYNNNGNFNTPINTALFEWVIENLCKNAIDAMSGDGKITTEITDNFQMIYIDISDTGKGVSKSKFKTVFNPGFTTKKRGWGLGLSLTKRIIENYHKGKIFIKSSEPNIKTTFRIVLKK